jgi:hypothetical protein
MSETDCNLHGSYLIRVGQVADEHKFQAVLRLSHGLQFLPIQQPPLQFARLKTQNYLNFMHFSSKRALCLYEGVMPKFLSE